MGKEEWAGARLGMPLMLCSQVWYHPPKQEHTKGFKGLWGEGGGYMTRFAFYLSCLFRFVFIFYIPNILLCSKINQSFLGSFRHLSNLERPSFPTTALNKQMLMYFFLGHVYIFGFYILILALL